MLEIEMGAIWDTKYVYENIQSAVPYHFTIMFMWCSLIIVFKYKIPVE